MVDGAVSSTVRSAVASCRVSSPANSARIRRVPGPPAALRVRRYGAPLVTGGSRASGPSTGPTDSATGSSAGRSSAVARTVTWSPPRASSTSIVSTTWARDGSVVSLSCDASMSALPRNARSIAWGPEVTGISARNRPSWPVVARGGLVADLDRDDLARDAIAGQAVEQLAAELGLVVADQPDPLEREPGLGADLHAVRVGRGGRRQHAENEERGPPHASVIARGAVTLVLRCAAVRVVALGDVGYASGWRPANVIGSIHPACAPEGVPRSWSIMRIKRVEIIGFKSFCDRAVVQIGESITGVVGPNGCGKCNIVDAIRWCMGEQSAKHLRGKAMEDVIFAGSETRGPAPMAEVSLTFDDVGFSHEALELARHSDEAETERALDQLAPDATEEPEGGAGAGGAGGAVGPEAAPVAAPADAPVAAPVPEADAPAPEAAAGVWVDAEGNPIASPLEEAAQVLADRPPAINFGHYTEVTITRRLYRDGTSQYFINKTPCRLRDITDFFLGTGVGTKAYAIIEQGRIGQIVSSRPQDRRAIIEEAAGITKFKAKKKAAEKKLEQTRQNLMRVSDIVAELDKRMGTLRRQAQKAERYRKYKAEMRDIELWKAAHRWLELAGRGSARHRPADRGARRARRRARGVEHPGRPRRRRARRAVARGAPPGRRAGAGLRARQPDPARREQDRLRAPRGRGARRPDRGGARRDRRHRRPARARRRGARGAARRARAAGGRGRARGRRGVRRASRRPARRGRC